MNVKTSRTGLEIAIIGMAGTFPSASNTQQFWQNLLAGQSGISVLTSEELAAAGVHPAVLAKDNFIKSKGIWPDLTYFDASFFEYTPADANFLDPQARALHQCVFHALEDAGYAGDNYKGSIGLIVGSSGNFTWELDTILQSAEGSAAQFSALQLNDKDFVATRIAYKLNLRGPAVAVSCACSTSLYAIDMACRQLLTGACSMAMAAGSGLNLPSKNGYVYEDGMILSPDAECRPFSDNANGTIEGNGMGAVLLKPLEDALRDRDQIYAVICGTAANNDGTRKVGYTAPSVEGQSEAIRRALHMADFEAHSISYVEAHGTGTVLGDPVEIEGLKKAFRTEQTGFCAIGSLKSSIGHLDTAAGIAALIKTALALQHRYLPASLNFRDYNPHIDFANSPFYVVQKGQAWHNPAVPGSVDEVYPLRAGVSSFGIGGTNVHVVLEEAPALPAASAGRAWHTLCLSGYDEAALQRQQDNLQMWLEQALVTPGHALLGQYAAADLAYTLQTGRRTMRRRLSIAYQDCTQLLAALKATGATGAKGASAPSTGNTGQEALRRYHSPMPARAALLFSGQGTQYPGMALGLYQSEPAFAKALERCLDICDALGQRQLRAILLTQASAANEADEADQLAAQLQQTDLAQPALFIVEYAMAQLLQEWGITPTAMLGHSLGEYVAACIAGVFSLEDGLKLVLARGRLMQAMPAGAMLAVVADAAKVRALVMDFAPRLDLAASNMPQQCTVSGPEAEIEAFAAQLQSRGIQAKRLHTSHAFHSAMMEPVLEPLREVLNSITLHAPKLPYLSNLTGTWITPEQAQDPQYYLDHLRGAVRFDECAQTLLQDSAIVCIEVGPGNVLANFIKQNVTQGAAAARTVTCLRHVKSEVDDRQFLARAIGDMWGHGLSPDWRQFYRQQKRNKLAAPLYAFEREEFSLGRGDIYSLLETVNNSAQTEPTGSANLGRVNSRANHGAAAQVFGWQAAARPSHDEAFTVRPCLAIIEDDKSFAALSKVNGLRLDCVRNGGSFNAKGVGQFKVSLSRTTDYRRLIQYLKAADGVPQCLVWLAPGVTQTGTMQGLQSWMERVLRLVLALRSESPHQLFKYVLFLPYARPDEQHAARLDGYLRAIRASCDDCDIRAVYLHQQLTQRQREQAMEAEIYDTEQSIVLAAHDMQQRSLYLAQACALLPGSFERLRGQTIGLLSPQGFATGEIISHIVEMTGARILPLPYCPQLPSYPSSSLALDAGGLAEVLRPHQECDLGKYGLRDFSRANALIDEACTRMVADFLDQGVFALQVARIFTRQEMATALRVTEGMQKYVDYFLAMFLADGLITKEGEGYRVLRGCANLRALPLIEQELAEESSLFPGNVAMLKHCIASFGPALAEEISPISVLYPNGSNEMMLRTYQGSIQEKEEAVIRVVFEDLIKQILQSAGNRPIRILEAGGGFGLTMRTIVHLMRGMQVEYYFTDIGKTFLYEAKEFALRENIDFLHFGNFDITKAPAKQGLQEHSFDLVFAFNVVHATRNLEVSVGNMHRLLKNGGLMCLLERTVSRRYADLTWGLADGWWHFDDAERQLSPLIGLDQWQKIARKVGFQDILTFPHDAKQRACLETGIIIAQAGLAHGEMRQISKDANAPQWHLPTPTLPLDAVIVLETPQQREAEHYEAFGDGLLTCQLPNINHNASFSQAFDTWLAQHQPRSGSIWGSGKAQINCADQIGLLLEAQAVDAVAWQKLGPSSWSRVYLPNIAKLTEPAVLRQALSVMQGALPLVIVDAEQQSLFNLPLPRAMRSQANQADEKGDTAQLLQGQQSYQNLLHTLWSALFGIESIGIDEDFFELGGDSLKVAQLTGELERHGIKVMSNEIFNRPSIGALAHYLFENRQSEFGHLRSSEALLGHLQETYGWQVQNLVSKEGEQEYQSLLIDGVRQEQLLEHTLHSTGDARQHYLAALLAQLRLPPALEPHYIAFDVQEQIGNLPAAQDNKALWQGMGLLDKAAGDFVANCANRVNHAMRAMSSQLCSTPIVATYPLSPFQKMFLREENRFAFYLIDFDEPIDLSQLDRALTDIVRGQNLMRSKPNRGWFGNVTWEEHAAPQEDLHIPLLDLSPFVPSLQASLTEQIMETENQADFDAVPGVMFRVCLLRLDRRRHTLLFNLDHSIFDNMSGQVLRRQLLNRYRSLMSGSKAAPEPVKSFHHYLDQLNRGPQGISKERLLELFELKEYERVKDAVESRIVERRQPDIKKMRFTLDLSQYHLANDDEVTWELTLVVLCSTLARFLEQDSVPLKLLYQGRQYQDISYFDTLGLFIDVLPLLVKVDNEDPASMVESIKRKVRFVNRYNVSFMNMLLNLKMRFQWWDVLAPLNPKKLNKTDPMILLNYVGKAEAEYQKVLEFSTKQMEKSNDKPGYASLYITVTVVERNIHFDVFCNFEKDMDNLLRIFEDQARRLLTPRTPNAGKDAPPSATPTGNHSSVDVRADLTEE